MKFLRLLGAVLAGSTMLTQPASATGLEPFLLGIGASFGLGGGVGIFGTGLAAFNAGLGLVSFLGSPIGALLLSVGLSFVADALGGGSQSTPQDASRVNVRTEKSYRWLHLGEVRAGGAVIFGEYDADGQFWYVIVHGDSEKTTPGSLYLDDIPVTLDGSNQVITPEFTIEQEEGGTPAISVWTNTFQADDIAPPFPIAFKTAFSDWTDEHVMAGSTVSVVRINALTREDRAKIYRWRGPLGLGEPSVSIVTTWDRCYDPRDSSQKINRPETWEGTTNAALVAARFWTHPQGCNKPMNSVNWDRIADAADKSDVPIVTKDGDIVPAYQCCISVRDDTARRQALTSILMTCDASIFYDEAGKWYIEVGAWQEPAVTLTANRDILTMSFREAADGEAETDGVQVDYTEPEFGYIRQPAAPYFNPNYYEDGREPNLSSVEILGCPNHNQAVRLAKAIALRSHATYRLAPTVGLRGLLVRRSRVVGIDYDDDFNGPHEIVTPVELDAAGISSAFGVVPIDQYRWRLLPGEEGDRPAPSQSITYDETLPLPENVLVYSAEVPGSSGNSVRLEATFDPAPRADWNYEFEYRKSGDLVWKPYIVLMDEELAYTDTVEDGVTYEVHYRTVTTSGRASDWSDPPDEVVAIADGTPPDALSSVSVVGGNGGATINFTTPDSIASVPLYRVPTGVTLDRGVHLVTTYTVAFSTAYSKIDGDLRTNLLSNPAFSSDTVWTKGTGWTISGGKGNKTAGTNASLTQAIALSVGVAYRCGFTGSSISAGTVRSQLMGTTTVPGSALAANGVRLDTLTAVTGNNTYAINGGSTFAGSVDDAVLFAETGSCAPQGVWDYYIEPMNGSGVAGTLSGPHTVTVY